MMDERTEITPYRMAQLVKAASKIADQVCGVNGVLHITYEEMDIVLKAIRLFMTESIEHNKKLEEQEKEK